ncbi:MAG TPA: ParB/RepB/Spo0J family partition protein [Sedimentisphaerales bacterium]|nr:ParB/RepB/Spo0J family partition protein [Sedimentisphaerales bacterium]
MENHRKINIAKIWVGKHEQRVGDDEEQFNELCSSIGQVGLICPLVVSGGDDGYNLVAGHRRLAACKRLGFIEVDCIVRQPSDSVDAEITFAENFCRRNLTPIEQAAAILDCYEKEVMSVEQLAKAFHRSENWVAAQMDMVGWPDDVLNAIHREQISVSSAHNLAVIDDDVYRRFLLDTAIDSGATARTTSAWLQAWRSSRPQEEAVTIPPSEAGPSPAPLCPQAPCLCCGEIRRMDQLSHVPMCQSCIHTIRNVAGS